MDVRSHKMKNENDNSNNQQYKQTLRKREQQIETQFEKLTNMMRQSTNDLTLISVT